MTLWNFKVANNAESTLEAGISAGITTLILATGTRGRFPTTFPFYLTLEQYNASLQVVKREIVKVTAGATEALTIVRSAGYCPADYTAQTLTNTAFSFLAGDSVRQKLVAEIIDDLNVELVRLETAKLNISDFQNGSKVYSATSTWNDSYAITLSPALWAYAVWQSFRFLADVANTWPATLNVNWLWAKNILKAHDQALANGDIEANQIVTVSYDGTQFQMDSQVAILPSTADKISQSGTEIYWASSGGTDTYSITLSPVIGSYTTGMVINFLADVANTWPCTININSLWAKTIKKFVSLDLSDNDILANSINTIIYDGTNFQLKISWSSTAIDVTQSVYLNFQIPMIANAGAQAWALAWWTQSGIDTASSEWSGALAEMKSNTTTAYVRTSLPATSSATTKNDFSISKKIIVSFGATYFWSGNRCWWLAASTGASFYDPTSVSHKAMFTWDGTNLKCETADGTTRTTNTIGGITVSNWNQYRIEINPGVNVKFYVNDLLKFTHTTNRPTTWEIRFWMGTNTSATFVYMSAPTISVAI